MDLDNDKNNLNQEKIHTRKNSSKRAKGNRTSKLKRESKFFKENEKNKDNIFLNKNGKKVLVVSIFVSIILELLLVLAFKRFSGISLPRIITIFAMSYYVLQHFFNGFKNVSDYIVEKRVYISGALIVFTTIIGFFENNYSIKEWFCDSSIFLSFLWNVRFYLTMLITYETFKIITDRNQTLSICGSIVVMFSSATLLNLNILGSLFVGELLVVLVHKYIMASRSKISWAIFIVLDIIWYTFTYTSFAVPMFYVFLAIIIWDFIENKKIFEDKSNIYLTIIVGMISFFAIIVFKGIIAPFNTDEAISIDGVNGIGLLLGYLYNIKLPVLSEVDSSLYAGIFSLFPIPLIVALFIAYKADENDKKISFLMPSILVLVFETVFVVSGIPFNFINTITMFSLTNIFRVSYAVGLLSLYIVIYLLENIDYKLMKFVSTIRVSMIYIIILGLFLAGVHQTFSEFSSSSYVTLAVAESVLSTFLFLNFDDKNYKKTFIGIFIAYVMITGLYTKPIIIENNRQSLFSQITSSFQNNNDEGENSGKLN